MTIIEFLEDICGIELRDYEKDLIVQAEKHNESYVMFPPKNGRLAALRLITIRDLICKGEKDGTM